MTSEHHVVNASPAPWPAPGRLRTLTCLLALVCAACGGKAAAPPPPTEDAARIACDGFAARAIQTGDTAEAATLSQQAASCYAALQTASTTANRPAP